ncbi:class I SAM-dependent methyltransferase [Clavibacter capsici]|uniref:class I SAM-dependent methyltransferase n=1 Tax=Clavibacter capsici TaxID=1874630 RepID=UPI0014280CE5|nr:class I SAM-dependent methyltransferase [Clavibacter capsici]QIS39951.1 class I SAM-dependent methyltransferase [Clavibacter capsici]
MDQSDLREVLSLEGLRLLDSLPEPRPGDDMVRIVTALRGEGHSAERVSAVLTQVRLRARARAKFGDFAERMLFTEAGLEQATRLPVAAQHAGRFQQAGVAQVADLGCGIGGDAMAMAAIGIRVTAVERDEVTAAVAGWNLAPFPEAVVEQGTAEAFDAGRVDGVYLDPARRTDGHSSTRRISDPDAYSPTLSAAFALASGRAAGIKLGPGLDRDLIPEEAEAQWVSVDGQAVEMGLWFGPTRRDGVRRAALVISGGSQAELTSAADSEDAELGELGEHLYEPDGAVIRARLIGDVARSLDGRMVGEGIAWITSETERATPFARGFRVREVLPLDESRLRRELRARGIGTLEIKKRGVDVDPARLRTRLQLKGDLSATLIATRVGGRRVAIIADRHGVDAG